MFSALFRDRWLIALLFSALLLRLFALNQGWVERFYSLGFYPGFSRALRAAFGWLPFSAGDVLYLLAFVWLVQKTWKLVVLLKRNKARQHLSWMLLRKYVKLSLIIYLVFSAFWGLNYSRQGISHQLALPVQEYSVKDLFSLTLLLQQRLNGYAEKIDSAERMRYNNDSFLFGQSQFAYRSAAPSLPFLQYRQASIKPSLFTPFGQYFGFTGYYNPFTAEAQLKLNIPVFLKPFVVTHEMAHQLGYAKEDEASFVAWLTCKSSGNLYFLYSAYFELYRDAVFACRQTPNKTLTERVEKNIHSRVHRDQLELQRYLLRNRNFVEPFMSGLYDRYLKLNNQPKGKATYNEVIAYVLAYWKKYGATAM